MHSLNWKTDIENDNQVPKINWTALQEFAISLRNSKDDSSTTKTCHIPPIYNMGGLHLAIILEFDDGTKWVARIQRHKLTSELEKRLLHEIHTLSILHEQTDVPVPEVFGYETDPDLIGRAFMIMEFIPGNTGTDFMGPHSFHIPSQFKTKFYHEISRIHASLSQTPEPPAAMSTIRFPKIGMIAKRDDGTYEIEAIPGLGGPFNTTTEYFAAWGEHTKFPETEVWMRDHLPEEYADEVVTSIGDYPRRIKEQRFDITVRNEGPFPLRHTDFLHSNVIVDAEFNVLSVIDWEHAGTVPWERVEFPIFLSTLPPALDFPWKYGADGKPLDDDTRKDWEERENYVRSVEEAEKEMGYDDRLSSMLGSMYYQNLAACFTRYEEGKLGVYCRALDEFTPDKSVG
ncbi:Aminoglycoside phosphotransferase [Penicillium samsonianum]|uniref:Aminoglycoside phosphotransferase n=1 Tax=Penicillium samsonianum TaxID=1882272 RepID=UPI002549B3A2|nr:Aminoglycoside phosphotransferase [Penicillium samsonianum]KAJ6131795.1 Aminoglycoside phosphotransferase [Penicillium samsonianum]